MDVVRVLLLELCNCFMYFTMYCNCLCISTCCAMVCVFHHIVQLWSWGVVKVLLLCICGVVVWVCSCLCISPCCDMVCEFHDSLQLCSWGVISSCFAIVWEFHHVLQLWISPCCAIVVIRCCWGIVFFHYLVLQCPSMHRGPY